MAALQPFAEELWIADGPVVSMFGLRFPTRMAIVRLPDGALWIWSPIELTEPIREELDALGPVTHLVAPNKFHHVYLAPWAEAYPSASLWGGPGLASKRKDLEFTAELDDDAPPAWADALDQAVLRGSFVVEELWFFHRASRTVIACDALQQHDTELGGMQGWLKRMAGLAKGEPRVPIDFRATMLRRAKARESVDAIARWPAQRLVLAHGPCLQDGTAEVIDRAFAFLR